LTDEGFRACADLNLAGSTEDGSATGLGSAGLMLQLIFWNKAIFSYQTSSIKVTSSGLMPKQTGLRDALAHIEE
jgi:hypothetical protein